MDSHSPENAKEPFNAPMDDRLRLWVIIATDDTGHKEWLGLVDGYRELEARWHELLLDLEACGPEVLLKLTVAGGAMGLRKALVKQAAARLE